MMVTGKRILIFFVIILLATPVFANFKYFKMVQRSAEVYRVDCAVDQMKLVGADEDKQAFYLILKSNRNNFEMVMLVGFIAAGEAMKVGIEPDVFFVRVQIPLGEGFELLATASKEDLKRLMSGDINTAQFARIIQYL